MDGTRLPGGGNAAAATNTDSRSKIGLLLGVRLGGYVPLGSYPIVAPGIWRGKYGYGEYLPPYSTSESLSTVAGVGAAIGIEGAFRFAQIFFVGALLQGGAFVTKSGSADVAPTGDRALTTSVVLGTFGYISSGKRLGFLANIGVGRRAMTVSVGDSNSTSFAGPEFQLGIGVPASVAEFICVVPKVEVDFGNVSQEFLPGGNSVLHGFLFVGVGGYIDIDLGTKPSTPAATAR